MINAECYTWDFSDGIFLVIKEAISDVVRQTFLTFPMEPFFPYRRFFFDLSRVSVQSDQWNNVGGYKLSVSCIILDSGEIRSKSLLLLSIFRTSFLIGVQHLLLWRFKQITKIHSSFCFLLIKTFDYHLMAGGHHSQKPFASHYCILSKGKAEFKTCPRIHTYFLPLFERLRGVKSCT